MAGNIWCTVPSFVTFWVISINWHGFWLHEQQCLRTSSSCWQDMPGAAFDSFKWTTGIWFSMRTSSSLYDLYSCQRPSLFLNMCLFPIQFYISSVFPAWLGWLKAANAKLCIGCSQSQWHALMVFRCSNYYGNTGSSSTWSFADQSLCRKGWVSP